MSLWAHPQSLTVSHGSNQTRVKPWWYQPRLTCSTCSTIPVDDAFIADAISQTRRSHDTTDVAQTLEVPDAQWWYGLTLWVLPLSQNHKDVLPAPNFPSSRSQPSRLILTRTFTCLTPSVTTFFNLHQQHRTLASLFYSLSPVKDIVPT
jgi:hypothetical protein